MCHLISIKFSEYGYEDEWIKYLQKNTLMIMYIFRQWTASTKNK